jgi:hypothetical protein
VALPRRAWLGVLGDEPENDGEGQQLPVRGPAHQRNLTVTPAKPPARNGRKARKTRKTRKTRKARKARKAAVISDELPGSPFRG